MVMNNSLWTTYSQSLNNFEFSHFCRFFPILFDSYRHSLLKSYFNSCSGVELTPQGGVIFFGVTLTPKGVILTPKKIFSPVGEFI